MAAAPQQIDFGSLARAVGPQLALFIFSLFNPGSSPLSKATGGAQLAGLGAKAANVPGAGAVGPGLATAGGLYNLATSPNYQGKLLGGVQAGLAAPALANATGVGAGAIGGAAPAAGAASGYLAAAILTDYLINKTGAAEGGSALNRYTKGVDAFVKPQGVQALFGGHPLKQNIGQAMTGFAEDAFGATPFMAALGLGPFNKPTQGTMYRNELGQILNNLPGLKGEGIDTGKYNIDPAYYNSLPQGVRDAAKALGIGLEGLAPHGAKNPDAYAIQGQNILLNRYGTDLPDAIKRLQAGIQQQAEQQAQLTKPLYPGINQQVQNYLGKR